MALNLIFLLAVISGCSTPKSRTPTPQPGGSYKLVHNIAGVEVAIYPITDPNDVAKRFSANILEWGILPVFVVATNTHNSPGFVISSFQFVLINGTWRMAGGEVRNANSSPNYALALLPGGGGAVNMLFASVFAKLDSTPVNQYIRQEMLAAKSMSPGIGTHGYLYFRLPQKQERQLKWAVKLEVVPINTTNANIVYFEFDWDANKAVK